MIRVLLADDQALVRGGFRLILDTEPDMEVVAEAADGDQALAGALETRPDVVLMDIRMPVLDGIEATRRLVPQLGGTRVVILTTFDLDDYVADVFRAALRVSCSRPPRPRSSSRRSVPSTRATGCSRRPDPPADRAVHPARRARSPARGADRPRAPMCSAARRGTVRRRDRGEAAPVELSTVKSHVASLLAKLGLRDRVQAVVFAYENGLVRPGERT